MEPTRTLMELVEDCEQSDSILCKDKANTAKDLTEDLKSLGFSAAATKLSDEITVREKLNRITKGGYIKITPEKICKYIDKTLGTKYSSPGWFVNNIPSGMEDVLECNYAVSSLVTIRQGFEVFCGTTTLDPTPEKPWRRDSAMCWVERKIELYQGIPPQHILDRLKEEKARNVFDYYTVSDIRSMEIPIRDPLLLGRIDGSQDRFFIAQWGDDIHVEDLL